MRAPRRLARAPGGAFPALRAARRRFALAAFLLCAACARSSTPEDVARRFIEEYYVRVDLGAARRIADGLASRKIDEQVALRQGQALGGAVEGRNVAYHLVRRQQDGDRHSFMYEVRIRPTGGGEFTRRSVVAVTPAGGAWRVSNFTEPGS